jgi:hypothetical protein
MGPTLTELERLVSEAASSASTLSELVARSRGAFPTEVLTEARRLGLDVELGPSELLEVRPGPPIHPLDYDWRFNARTVGYLRAALTSVGTSTAFVCCPSLCVETTGLRRTALVDRNALWTTWVSSEVEFVVADLSQTPDDWQDAFDAVMLDPPWYEDEFRRGLVTAARLVRDGGMIFVSWPAHATRPFLRDELSRFLAFANALGLELESVDESVLTYATPFFEGVSMRAAGLPVLAAWRQADLIRFVRRKRVHGSHDDGSVQRPPLIEWTNHHVGRLQIRLAKHGTSVVDPRLVSLVEGDILRSVSRRDPVRASARAWTGANRIFHCDTPDLLATVVQHLFEGPVPHLEAKFGRTLTSDERGLVEEAAVQIRNLEAREANEYDLLHGITPPASGSRVAP